MPTLKSKMLQLADSMPKGSSNRKALLNILSTRMKKVEVSIPEDIRIRGYGTFYAGNYLVKMPFDYDADEVGAEDIVMDGEITLIRRV